MWDLRSAVDGVGKRRPSSDRLERWAARCCDGCGGNVISRPLKANEGVGLEASSCVGDRWPCRDILYIG